MKLSDNETLTIGQFGRTASQVPEETDPLFATRQIASVAYATWVSVLQAADKQVAKEPKELRREKGFSEINLSSHRLTLVSFPLPQITPTQTPSNSFGIFVHVPIRSRGAIHSRVNVASFSRE